MFAELESLRGASTDEALERRTVLAEQVTIELVRHSVAEEVLVYPEVEDKVSREEACAVSGHRQRRSLHAPARLLSGVRRPRGAGRPAADPRDAWRSRPRATD